MRDINGRSVNQITNNRTSYLRKMLANLMHPQCVISCKTNLDQQTVEILVTKNIDFENVSDKIQMHDE